ncbi:polysaccharide deacetylase family protein [Aromatoleum anaerobium]|uniref:Polysaccharide deacetylase family protein n=1 Tax=Aromatoleum anaerobium TaxID=182180 RepID=A0ABX1PHQ3_9RHOO|nr:polysaccharide deacetylase family protein [Aromatoleum anaerobium]MCK0509202.1 polysaccharide deacetylase family protein [Aromatoleum anaerobium]
MIDPLSRFFERAAGMHGPVMLMYHSVTDGGGTPEWPWAVSRRRFRGQLDYLANEGWATPTMSELLAAPTSWPQRTAAITFDDGYANNLAACAELEKRGMCATWFIVSGSIGQAPSWPATGRPEGRLLNAVELREMRSAGMEIGSHTVNHVRLTELDEDRQRFELECSRRQIEDVLGGTVRSFAYPYGAWDDACVTEVREAGYQSACTTRTGWALRDGNPFLLRRLTVFNTDTVGSLIRKLCFGSNDVSWTSLTNQTLRSALAWLRRSPR